MSIRQRLIPTHRQHFASVKGLLWAVSSHISMGCCSSLLKTPAPVPAEDAAYETIPSPSTPIHGVVIASGASKKLKVFIIYYSMYGHVEVLAKRMKAGVDSVEGVEGYLYRVEETLPVHVLEKMKAPEKDESVPIISIQELPHADGFVFGFPTRFGAMAAQMKAFFDSTGSLWQGQVLAGKPASIFVSTGTQGGGQETTILTSVTQLVHHGMLYVPIGYTFGADMSKLDNVRGGSPYGAGTYAGGDGLRMPSEIELALAQHQGKYTASVVKKLH